MKGLLTILSSWISKYILLGVVLGVGKNVLFYLIVTNITLFMLVSLGVKNYFDVQYVFILFILILFYRFI